jgi:anhydro-N-acetylmuramic acid kinase
MLDKMLQETLPAAKLRNTDELGLPADAKEAIAFALIGYQTIHGRPGNVATCTGADHPAVLGSLTPGDNYRELMRQIAGEPQREIKRLTLRQG